MIKLNEFFIAILLERILSDDYIPQVKNFLTVY